MSTPEERPAASAGRSAEPDELVEPERAAQTQPRTRPGERARPERTAASRSESIGAAHFLTVAEVAAIMRVSKMTVYRMVHNGEIAAVRVGRSFRVPEQAVHDYLDKAFIETG